MSSLLTLKAEWGEFTVDTTSFEAMLWRCSAVESAKLRKVVDKILRPKVVPDSIELSRTEMLIILTHGRGGVHIPW